MGHALPWISHLARNVTSSSCILLYKLYKASSLALTGINSPFLFQIPPKSPQQLKQLFHIKFMMIKVKQKVTKKNIQNLISHLFCL